MTPEVRAAVLDYVRAIASEGTHVPHPLDIMIARVP